MKYTIKRAIHNTNSILDKPITIIVVLLILFAYFAYGNFQFQKNNQNILLGIASIQKKQDQSLQAIKDVTTDTRLTAERQTAIIICMLQVPIEQRTPNLLENCRQKSDRLPVSIIQQAAPTIAQKPSASNPSQPSATTTPQTPASQPPASKPVEVMGIPLCVPFVGLCINH